MLDVRSSTTNPIIAFVHFLFVTVVPNIMFLSFCVVIPVVESLLLTYDWRRLNDITWFRKCWYHNGLMEALFTGHKPNDDVKSFDTDQSNTSLLHQDLNEGKFISFLFSMIITPCSIIIFFSIKQAVFNL